MIRTYICYYSNVWFVIHDSVKLKTQFKYVGIVCVLATCKAKLFPMFPQPYIQSCRFKQMISQHGCSRLSIASGHPIVLWKAANSISEITAIPFSTSFTMGFSWLQLHWELNLLCPSSSHSYCLSSCIYL
jgi:hypothetical protein